MKLNLLNLRKKQSTVFQIEDDFLPKYAPKERFKFACYRQLAYKGLKPTINNIEKVSGISCYQLWMGNEKHYSPKDFNKLLKICEALSMSLSWAEYACGMIK